MSIFHSDYEGMNGERDDSTFTVILFNAFMCIIIYISANCSGYSPVDQCANDIREALSPHQIELLTEDKNTYEAAANFCKSHLSDYQEQIKRARSFPEFSINH